MNIQKGKPLISIFSAENTENKNIKLQTEANKKKNHKKLYYGAIKDRKMSTGGVGVGNIARIRFIPLGKFP